ncbi:GNAT family N-acetyltransferase [Angustibacter peucedani]
MSARYVVRALELGDADELGRVHTLVWQQTYAGLMPDDYLASRSAERSAERFRQQASQPAPGVVDLVGLADGVPVGFASAGPTRDEPADPPHELYVVNVLAAHHGTGLGEELFTRAVRETAGDGPVSLWVLRGNERAAAFYRRHGFAPDGTSKPHEPTGTTEDRWVRR